MIYVKYLTYVLPYKLGSVSVGVKDRTVMFRWLKDQGALGFE